MLASMLLIWSTRLTTFLLARMVYRDPLDSRMNVLLKRTWTLIAFFFVHGSWGFIVSLPVTITLSSRITAPLSVTNWFGVVVYALGMYMEALADYVKHKNVEKRQKQEVSAFKPHWLWHYTRNPNFCGECFVWLGIYLTFIHPSATLHQLLPAALSPAFTFVVMLFGAAVNASELKNNRRYGHLASYRQYHAATSVLWPCPPQLYKQLPQVAKTSLYFDFQLYHKGLKTD